MTDKEWLERNGFIKYGGDNEYARSYKGAYTTIWRDGKGWKCQTQSNLEYDGRVVPIGYGTPVPSDTAENAYKTAVYAVMQIAHNGALVARFLEEHAIIEV